MDWFNEKMERLVRSEAPAIERRGTISPKVLEAIYDGDCSSLSIPEELGGHMLPLPEALRVFEGASRIDGSFGWLVTIGAGGGYFAASHGTGDCRKLLSPREAVIAGSEFPAERPGGWKGDIG